MKNIKKKPVNLFVSNVFTDVFLTHEDFIRNDQIRSADGFRTTTYSSDLMIAVRRVKGLERIDAISHPKHKYIGKSFIDPFDFKKKTIVDVWEHFGFGNYFIAIYELNGSHCAFTIQSEGTAIEKYFDRERSLLIEEQLK